MNPTITVLANGHALIFESPTGLVAVPLSDKDSDRLFDAGVNYEDEVEGAALEALQELM